MPLSYRRCPWEQHLMAPKVGQNGFVNLDVGHILSGMGKNIGIGPSSQVHTGPRRQEIKAGLRDIRTILPREPVIKNGFERMKMQNI